MSFKFCVETRSNQRQESSEIISTSVLLCETAVCILQVRATCTSVQRPKMQNVAPEVDFVSPSRHLRDRNLEIDPISAL